MAGCADQRPYQLSDSAKGLPLLTCRGVTRLNSDSLHVGCESDSTLNQSILLELELSGLGTKIWSSLSRLICSTEQVTSESESI